MASAERQEILDIDLQRFFRAVTDLDAYPKFVTGMKGTRVLSGAGSEDKTVEFDLDMMKRIKYTVKMHHHIDVEKGEATVNWSLGESDVFKVNNGSWTMKAHGPGKLAVTYKLELDFKIMVPGFMLKGMVSTALPKAIQEFYNQAKTY